MSTELPEKKENALNKKRKNNSHRAVNTVSAARELYFDAIAQEALSRAGDKPQLKGVVHELLFRDKQNLSPKNLLEGNVTKLTKSPHAHSVDLVTMNKNGRPIARYQLKDRTSPDGIYKTLRTVRSGKYRTTKLMGTKETVTKYKSLKTPGDKEMTSTGISSKRTGRIADNAGVSSRDAKTVLKNFKDIGSCAGTSAIIGAAAGAGTAICGNYKRYKNGEIDGLEYAGKVACGTVKTAATTGGTTAAALALKEGGKALGKSLGFEGFKRVAGSNVGTAVAFGVVEIGLDTVSLAQGKISSSEFAQKATATTGGAAGGLGGAMAGAAIGTAVCPGIGTAIGAGLGAITCGIGGRALLGSIGRWIWG